MATSKQTPPTSARPESDRLPVWRMGLTGGLVGILCCVGPTVLALVGVVSAGTAFAWATNLYDNHAWWFRLGGLAVLAVLVWVSLRRRNQCSIAGLRRWRWRLLAVLGIAAATYGALYGLTTCWAPSPELARAVRSRIRAGTVHWSLCIGPRSWPSWWL